MPTLGETDNKIPPTGIVDERRYWGKSSQLLGVRRDGKQPYHGMSRDGVNLRAAGKSTVYRVAVGMVGYHAGPDVHIIDPLALGDAFLPLLPAHAAWRPGHYGRYVPAGYYESADTGECQLIDEDLAKVWHDVQLVVRGPLFSRERFAAIWRLRSGQNDDLIDRSFYKDPVYTELPAHLLQSERKRKAQNVIDPGSYRFDPRKGLTITFEARTRVPFLQISAQHDDVFRIVFFDGEDELGEAELEKVKKPKKRGLYERLITVPQTALQRGFDRIRLEPIGDDPMVYIGHMFLLYGPGGKKSSRSEHDVARDNRLVKRGRHPRVDLGRRD